MPSRFHIKQAAQIIEAEGVIAYPTESVFGLGCDPFSETAVKHILDIKHRPIEKGLILIASSLHQLEIFTRLTQADKKTISDYSSPMTWLVDKSIYTPHWISGKHDKVAVRISQHPTVISLCNQLQQAIISTSANPAGISPAQNCLRTQQYFGESVDYYLCGSTGNLLKPTPITDLKTGKQLR